MYNVNRCFFLTTGQNLFIQTNFDVLHGPFRGRLCQPIDTGKVRDFLAHHMYSLEDVIVGAGPGMGPRPFRLRPRPYLVAGGSLYCCFLFARPQRAVDGQLGGLTCPAQD